MDNRIKRFEKKLRDKGGKGLFKPVDNLESSHFVLEEDTRCRYKSMLFKTEDYKAILERGETYLTLFIFSLLVIKETHKI